MTTPPPTFFHVVDEFPGWGKARNWIVDIIQRNGCKDILEVGSGANPTLSPEQVSQLGLRYTTNDVSSEELKKADPVFERWEADVSAPVIPGGYQGRFDLVFSRMVNEHVSDGERYHANICALLKPNGISAHCFSTLYTLPFVVNWIAPGALSKLLLQIACPREDEEKHGKFRAHYSWSRGPSQRMIRRFESLGYSVIEYHGYFGHTYYRRWSPLLDRIESLKSRTLLSHPAAVLCSYAMIVLRKRP